MEIANTAAEIQRNMAIQKGIDPKEQWWEGLNRIEFRLANLAGGALYGGVHEATSIKPNTEEPGVTTVETPHVPGKIVKTAPEPEVPLSGHQTGPEYMPNVVGAPQQQAATVEENGETVNVPIENEQQPEQVSAPIEQAPETTPEARPAEQAEPNVPVAQTPERGVPEAQPQPSAQTLPNREDLRESPPVRPETYTPGEKPVRRTKAQAAWEEEQRQQAIDEANETAPGRSQHQGDLLTSTRNAPAFRRR